MHEVTPPSSSELCEDCAARRCFLHLPFGLCAGEQGQASCDERGESSVLAEPALTTAWSPAGCKATLSSGLALRAMVMVCWSSLSHTRSADCGLGRSVHSRSEALHELSDSAAAMCVNCGCGISRCSYVVGTGVHSEEPTCKYGMLSSTTRGIVFPQGATKYGWPPAGQTKLKPCSEHRFPTDERGGVEPIAQNSVCSRNSVSGIVTL